MPTPAEKTFPAVAASLPLMSAFVSEAATAAGLDRKHELRLLLALEEAVVNVCNHAYHGSEGDVRVRFRDDNRTCEVELEYGGPPFDPLTAPMPDAHAGLDARRPGGLGLLLMRRFLDGKRYARTADGNRLTLVIGKAGAGLVDVCLNGASP
jgi:anti-sigma regulatory factor (Ser/Thr protein kinase)